MQVFQQQAQSFVMMSSMTDEEVRRQSNCTTRVDTIKRILKIAPWMVSSCLLMFLQVEAAKAKAAEQRRKEEAKQQAMQERMRQVRSWLASLL